MKRLNVRRLWALCGLLAIGLLVIPPGRAGEPSAADVLARYSGAADLPRGKRIKLKFETVLSGDTTPAKFVFGQGEIDLTHLDEQVKALVKSCTFDRSAGKLRPMELSEVHSDFAKKLEFPRQALDSTRIKTNPLVLNRKARTFGDVLFDVDAAAAAVYGYVDPTSGLSIADTFREHPKPPVAVVLDGRPMVRLTAWSKWGTATAYFDPGLDYSLYKYELVKAGDSVVAEANSSPKLKEDLRVKDQPPTKKHPIYPNGVYKGMVYSVTAGKSADFKGVRYAKEFVLGARTEFTSGKSYEFTTRVSIEEVAEAAPAALALDTEVPKGTHVYVHDQRESPIQYEWRDGEVVKSSDNAFVSNLKARFSRGGWWSWGGLGLLVITAGAGGLYFVVRRRAARRG